MPAKPAWVSELPRIINDLQQQPELLDRSMVEIILGTGRRRTQQILAGCTVRRVGSSSVTTKTALLDRLQSLANGRDDPHGAERETERRRKLAATISRWQRDRQEKPQLLVEAPSRIVHQRMKTLPKDVTIERGRITVKFQEPGEALEKLLALAMAIGNDFEEFINSAS